MSTRPAQGAPRLSVTRRQFIAGGATCGVLLAHDAFAPARATSAEALDELQIWGPPAGPSITIQHAIATGRLRSIARKVSIRVWRDPDEMRAGLTSKTMRIGVMPVAAAANLYNRGMGVRLMNVMTNGLLYIVSADAALTTLPRLAGKKLAVPFPNDTPALLLNRLLRHHDLQPAKDLEVTVTASPLEAMQLLVLGRVDAALVPEPAASAAIIRGAVAGKTIQRVIDIQQEWGRLTGKGQTVPQAGLAVTDSFRDQHPRVLEAIQLALRETVADVVANPARAANSAAVTLQMPWPVIEKAIPFSNLVAVPASEARASIEAMLAPVAEDNAAIIGGRLPDPAFYL